MFFGTREIGSVYFVGIGGVSMSALAQFLHGCGVAVSGSDDTESAFTRLLKERGILVSIGTDEEIKADIAVYTGAVDPDLPRLKRAREAGIETVERSEFLGRVASLFPEVVSVAGCHGKTTTTCMLSHIFSAGGKAFTAHIGGSDLRFGNFVSTGKDYFLTEACEFRRSFLSLSSTVAVILNCDLDHTDCYRSEEELLEAYRAFAAKAERVVVNADDKGARSIPHALSFGLHAGRIRAERLRSYGEKYAFTVTDGEIPLCRVRLNAVGKVNVYNALASVACARLLGFGTEEIVAGLQSFRGVVRRFERVGTLCGAPVICDYAHHPREIAATLSTAERLCEGRVRLVFQPHTYTRTRDLMDEFVAVLRCAERPILYETYAAREKFDFDGSAVALAANVPQSAYARSPEQLRRLLSSDLKESDLVLVLGAGNIYDAVRGILDGENRQPRQGG